MGLASWSINGLIAFAGADHEFARHSRAILPRIEGDIRLDPVERGGGMRHGPPDPSRSTHGQGAGSSVRSGEGQADPARAGGCRES